MQGKRDGASRYQGVCLLACATQVLTILIVVASSSAPAVETFTSLGSSFTGITQAAAGWADYNRDGKLDFVIAGQDTGGIAITKLYRNTGSSFVDSGVSLTGMYLGAVSWGDFDNDGDLDLAVSGFSTSGAVSKLYRNDSGTTFVSVAVPFEAVYYSSLEWGDYNNDGRLDILLTGTDGVTNYTKIYRNTGGGNFVDSGIFLPAVYNSAAVFGDYDKDGDLDIALAGIGSSGRVTKIYRNDGGGTFTDIGAAIPGVSACSLQWIDYENDGDLDLSVSGDRGSAGRIVEVYVNNGGTFTAASTGLPGVSNSTNFWGDFDNDGDTDLLLAGYSGTSPMTGICRNTSGSFADIEAGLPQMYYSSALWGDYDQDGDLDVLLTGNSSSGLLTRVYRSDGATTNTAPTVPPSLSSSNSGTSITFAWNASTDTKTPANAITYNLRVGTSSGASDVLSAASLSNGVRTMSAPGNTGERRSWTINGLNTVQTYYWSVQAVDGAYMGSAFAAEKLTGAAGIDSWVLY